MTGHPLPLRTQADLLDRWLAARLTTLLPRLMDRAGLDCWVVVAREYNEDPVLAALLPGTWANARRRTMLVFSRTPDGVDCAAVAPYAVGTCYRAAWEPAAQTQWQALHRIVAGHDPRRIGLDTSADFALADGLSATERTLTLDALGPYADRVVAADDLAVGVLETRLPEEIVAAHELNAVAHAVIAEAFGPAVVRPGRSTALDIAWWIQQCFHDRGLAPWFQSTVDIQRRGAPLGSVPDDDVIRPGDLLHCDVGLTSLRLHTDTQQNAYVLAAGETAAPAGLVEALAVGNQLQDLTVAAVAVGRTGNEILAAARTAAATAGVEAAIYSHPIGLHGHAAGPTIGLWDQQDGVPGSGDYPVHPDTLYALELASFGAIADWDGQRVRMALEQGIAVTGGERGLPTRVDYLDRRQTRLIVI